MNHQLALDEQQGNRRTKQVVVYTLCGIAWLCVATICYLAIKDLPIPDALDRLATFILGSISGVLAKTAADRVMGAEPVPVKSTPGQPLETTEVPAEPEKEVESQSNRDTAG